MNSLGASTPWQPGREPLLPVASIDRAWFSGEKTAVACWAWVMLSHGECSCMVPRGRRTWDVSTLSSASVAWPLAEGPVSTPLRGTPLRICVRMRLIRLLCCGEGPRRRRPGGESEGLPLAAPVARRRPRAEYLRRCNARSSGTKLPSRAIAVSVTRVPWLRFRSPRTRGHWRPSTPLRVRITARRSPVSSTRVPACVVLHDDVHVFVTSPCSAEKLQAESATGCVCDRRRLTTGGVSEAVLISLAQPGAARARGY